MIFVSKVDCSMYVCLESFKKFAVVGGWADTTLNIVFPLGQDLG